MDAVFKALADNTRREILQMLRNGEMSVSSITEQFEISVPSISRHLNVLKTAKLVTSKRRGQLVYYAINIDARQEILTEIWNLFTKTETANEP